MLCLYDRAGGGGSCLESIGREHCRSCGGPENRRTFVLYYDLLKGTTIGTSTDGTGHYYLKNLPEGEFTVVMKTMGYKTIETPVMLKKVGRWKLTLRWKKKPCLWMESWFRPTGTRRLRRMAPSLVNVLDSKMFETTHATSLADGLNFQPGVRVENNCQNCGFQQVRINGLEGPYTQILVDSRPIFSALTGVYGLEQIPANMIERVEIMRGGGSALFGSSAIAGTINIITKSLCATQPRLPIR